ncbi:MAG: hypothetical protein ABW039_03315 [Sphingobium sp.]
MGSHGEHGLTTDHLPSPIGALARPRQVMVVLACFTATLSAALIYDVLPPIMTDLARHFGGGDAGAFRAQLAGTLPLFGVMIGGLLSGPAIERFALRPTLLVAMVLFGMTGSAPARASA